MSYVTRDPRLVVVPQEHREWLAALIREHGVPGTVRQLGGVIARTALLGIVARGECMAGTAALLREAHARRAA